MSDRVPVLKGWAEFHADGRLFKDGLGNVLVYGRRPDKRMRQIMGDVRPVVIIEAPKKRRKK